MRNEEEERPRRAVVLHHVQSERSQMVTARVLPAAPGDGPSYQTAGVRQQMSQTPERGRKRVRLAPVGPCSLGISVWCPSGVFCPPWLPH